MRLTVNLDDDLYAIAASLSREADISLTAAVNRLVRRGVTPALAGTGLSVSENGWPVVRGTRPITSDDVARIEEEYGP